MNKGVQRPEGGNTGDNTSAANNEAGAGGRHGARTAARERVAGRREQLAGESYEVLGGGEGFKAYRVLSETLGVRGDGGGREAYGVAENPGGNRQGVQGGVKSPQGIDTPGVDALPQGGRKLQSGHQGRQSDEGGRTGAGRGWKPPHHLSGDSGNNEDMMSGTGLEVSPIPQQGMAAGRVRDQEGEGGAPPE